MFTHVHYVNGVMIAHSHPNKGKHSHTKSELVVIGRLSSVQVLEAALPTYSEPLRPLLCYVEEAAEIPVVAESHLRVLSLRAPPGGLQPQILWASQLK